MSSLKLKDRIDNYINLSDHKLLNRIPLIININGKSFHKVTSFLDKPFCPKFSDSMLSTTVKLCMNIEGAVFAYQHNDDITIVVRNDQTPDTSPWFDNKIQKICSITSSIATQHFNMFANNVGLNLIGDALFTSQIFCVPNIQEVINTIIYNQQHNFYVAIQLACFYELIKTRDKQTIKEMLSNLTIDEKIDLLNQECDVDFYNYPTSFRRGIACYKAPKIIDGSIKNKWTVNSELPIFTQDQSFLINIFKNGADIFRND